MTTRIDITLKSSSSLTPRELDEIWAVTDRYVDTDRATYETKLRVLPEVALWRNSVGTLIGLVSIDVYRVEWNGRTRVIFFTSSVVIDEQHRGRNLVLRTGVKAFLREKRRRPWQPAFWFFDSFSYKSYLILSRNLVEFWPRRDRPMPPDVARFMNSLATKRYGDAWSSTRGVVHHSGTKRLRADTAPITDRQRADPDVRFFEQANPGHADGDMLVCLVPLSVRNLGGAVLRALFKPRAPRRAPQTDSGD
ncbi:MAG TPA: hypothetical protein VGM50_22120 [Gemmatimonadaceae bacterium]|jgi:hypothetical protein